MNAKAKAEARRQAILAKGSKRLAKLTSSARGEDSIYDDPPLPTLPGKGIPAAIPPPAVPREALFSDSHHSLPAPGAAGHDQLLQSLMNWAPNSDGPQNSNPFANFLSPPETAGNPHFNPTFEPSAIVSQKASLAQRLTPALRLLSTLVLVAVFVIRVEPPLYARRVDHALRSEIPTIRWKELLTHPPAELGVQAVPIFWTFMSFQLVLHSARLFFSPNPASLPTIVALALPHLPTPFPTLIMNTYHYVHIGQVFLDDLATMLVAVGFCVWFASTI